METLQIMHGIKKISWNGIGYTFLTQKHQVLLYGKMDDIKFRLTLFN